jgi:hypothetical protein
MKHGMRAKVLLPDDLAAIATTRKVDLIDEIGPDSPYEEWLIGQMATSMAQLERCAELADWRRLEFPGVLPHQQMLPRETPARGAPHGTFSPLDAFGDPADLSARPASSLRREALGPPGPRRSLLLHPGDLAVELLAQPDGRLEEAQPGRRGVQIQLIPGRTAFETSVNM